MLLRTLLSLLTFVAWCLWTYGAAAHDPFEITTRVVIAGESLDVDVTLSARSARQVLELGGSDRRPLDSEALARDEARLRAAGARLYDISSGGRPLRFSKASVALTGDEDFELRLSYERPDPGSLRIHASYLERLDSGYTNAVTVEEQLPRTTFGLRFLDRDNPTLDIQVLADSGATSGAPAPSFGQFFVLGVHHLFTGYDHLLFLAGLLLAGGGFRRVIALVTCFTLAHSITLALASLDLIVLPSSVVEPLIAASIVCVALDNLLLGGTSRWRLLVTTAFGLIHGFGFASVLRELGLGGQGLTTVGRLFAFNAGIEVGQLAIALLTVPILAQLHTRNLLGLRSMRAASIAIALFGVYWLVERTVLA